MSQVAVAIFIAILATAKLILTDLLATVIVIQVTFKCLQVLAV